eukprot:gene4606-6483_t
MAEFLHERTLLLNRYSRQMLVPQVGYEGQLKLNSSKVLIVGAGGIGSTVALYLAGAGVPIHIMDFDKVEETNLHRQVIHNTSSLGNYKSDSAVTTIRLLNPMVSCVSRVMKLSPHNAVNEVSEYDVIVDATDNYEARYILNDACVINRKPLVTGAAVGMEGQMRVIIPYQTPCYRCLNPQPSVAESCRSCANAGVLGPVPGMIGCLQAIETIKLLLQLKNSHDVNRKLEPVSKDNKNVELIGERSNTLDNQTIFDGITGSFHSFRLPERVPSCMVCGSYPTILTSSDIENSLSLNCSIPIRPNLSSFESISAINYYNKYSNRHIFHIIIDVRSPIQFGMTSLRFSPSVGHDYVSFGSVDACKLYVSQMKNKDDIKSIIINIPLLVLKGGVESTSRHAKHKRELANLEAILQHINHIFTPTATATNMAQIRNFEGGLTSWQAEVESDFPMY